MSTEVAPGVHRLGSDLVSYYLVEDGDGLTLVDAGLPRQRRHLDRWLAARGRTLADLDAVVLTHAHTDHIGFAEEARRAGVPVHVHAAEADTVRAGTKHPVGARMLPYLRHPAAWRLLAGFLRGGTPPAVPAVEPFDGDAELDVPGRPRLVHTPGHSPGHCVVFLPDRGVVITGDALCTANPLTGRPGPQILPGALNRSDAGAMESLARLEPLDAPTVLFAHGDPWREGIASAVARAREAGTS
jgi:glyoxylase-like metal-dependent hydrolase (beta-lactamase superfamily II)